MTLATQLTQADDVWTLKIIGFVNASTSYLMLYTDSSQSLLKKLIEAEAKALVIDLSEADGVDSHGLRLLIDAQKEFSAKDIQIILRQPNAHLSRLFRIMQFDRLFTVEW
jgi:anti-anti-sigma factor